MALLGMRHSKHSEGSLAKAIEQQTAKLPSDVFLWAGIAFAGISLLSMVTRTRKDVGLFVGEWVPTILLFGIYNKIVKVVGSEPR